MQADVLANHLLVSVFSKPNIVRLNLSHCEFPSGLYGEVTVLSTPYILHKASMICCQSFCPGHSVCMLVYHTHETNVRLELLVLLKLAGCWKLPPPLNFVKASVITRTFSLPPLDGFTLVKSKQTKSSGL